jgi:hypothetical protein
VAVPTTVVELKPTAVELGLTSVPMTEDLAVVELPVPTAMVVAELGLVTLETWVEDGLDPVFVEDEAPVPLGLV